MDAKIVLPSGGIVASQEVDNENLGVALRDFLESHGIILHAYENVQNGEPRNFILTLHCYKKM